MEAICQRRKSSSMAVHGNAGRKAQFNEPTKVIRVPESQVNFIKNWLLNNVKTNNQTI
jgi:hypothetical protein